MRIRVGNQSAFYAASVMGPFEYAVAHGFDAFEWFPDKKESGEGWTEADLSEDARRHIRETAAAKDIALSMHVSSHTNPLKQETAELLARDVGFARDTGARLFNTHFCSDGGIGAYVESITPLMELLSGSGIMLSIENTIGTSPQDFNGLFKYLRGVGFPYISSMGVCLDIGHANLCDSTRNDYLRYFDSLDPDVPIVHIHMHENYGDYDSHLTIFTGPAGKDSSGVRGLISRLVKRGFTGSIILEQWPEPPSLLDNARNRILGIIGSSDDIRREKGKDFVREIVGANRRFPSWRRRLEWINDFVGNRGKLDQEELVYISVYLRFLGTGKVPCAEEGGHHRPSVHARISQKIYERLSGLSTAHNVFIIRKIYPWLPSFSSPFMRSEPLTRIRDIAHRNDIPQELKKEIKLMLQNKLHRSAGPEDLATSGALLKKITAPGASYPHAFVKEFRLFHGELKSFFNARSLDEELNDFLKQGGSEDDLIRIFLEAKERAVKPSQVLNTLKLLTELRERLGAKLRESAGAEGHRLQLVDIGLEDFSFVLLSRLINYIETDDDGWALMLKSLPFAVRNLRLSQLEVEECIAVESELKEWTRKFDKEDRDQFMRLKATVDRCRRLAEGYCDKILELFPERVERLGRALGVAENEIRIFAEADVRGHPIFQLSKLVSILLKKIRELAVLPPWDVIVPGTAAGLVIAAPNITRLPAFQNGPVIALLDQIEGDEDIPDTVAGIVAAHEIPILSHLAVRVRQRKVVFAACDDSNLFFALKKFVGRKALLDVSPEGLNLNPADENKPVKIDVAGAVSRYKHAPVTSAVPTPQCKLIPLDKATPENGGNKAFAARRLAELSLRGAGFKTPAGVVIPSCVLEESLRSSPLLEKEYQHLINELDGLSRDDLDGALRRLKDIIGEVEVPEDIVTAVEKAFGKSEKLIVRSSSNCEDMEGFSGAGIYDSVPNVVPSRVAQAVRTVWASLWKRTASSALKNAGIPFTKVHMSVLIQQMFSPELSFIMHTVNPVTGNRAEVYLEIAVGLGETLASAETPGVPYRMVFDKNAEEVRMLAFASFSSAAWPDEKGGIMHKTTDYSRIDFSRDKRDRNRIGARLGTIGRFVEDALGGPQDIEGLISEGIIYLVQSRPEQGVESWK